jgi:ArsR family transcriptional regulator
MPITKTEEFGKKEQEIALIAKALSHPARVKILKILASKSECVCGQIVEVLPLAQSTVSQHLKELQNAGLVQGTIDGPRSCYCINPKAFEKAAQMFGDFFSNTAQLNAKTNCC